MERKRYTVRENAEAGFGTTPGGVIAGTSLVDDFVAKEEANLNRRVRRHTKKREAIALAESAKTKSAEASDWMEPFEKEEPCHKLLDRGEARKVIAAVERSGDRDERNRMKSIVKLLGEKGQFRKLALVPHAWERRLELLQERFPNFAEPIAYLRRRFALSAAGDATVAFTPIILDGPPGCGKSMFAEALAKFLSVPWRRINAETLQDGSSLTGSADFWANTRPGVVFDILIESDVATPLIFVDELDKVRGSHRYDPYAGFYSLLEPGTARTFRDLSVPGLALDASRILWVCTSNDFSRIPEPIRSRLRLFHIPAPTPEQARHIASEVYRDVLEGAKVSDFAGLTEAVIDRVAELSPRLMRAALQEALGSALCAQRRELVPDDIPGEPAPVIEKPSRPIGISLQPRLVLFVDFRGVLHPEILEDWEELVRRLESGERTSLRYAPVLEDLIGDRKDIGICLTCNTGASLTEGVLRIMLGDRVGRLVVGRAPDIPVARPLRVAAYIAAEGISRWIAIDDERVQWPEVMQDRVVTTNSREGLGNRKSVARLRALLAQHGDQ